VSFSCVLVDITLRERGITSPSPSSQFHTEPSSLAREVRGLQTCTCGSLPQACLAFGKRRRSSRRDGCLGLPLLRFRLTVVGLFVV
jgi:hypothetical protein